MTHSTTPFQFFTKVFPAKWFTISKTDAKLTDTVARKFWEYTEEQGSADISSFKGLS